jgi:hypothetical protein
MPGLRPLALHYEREHLRLYLNKLDDHRLADLADHRIVSMTGGTYTGNLRIPRLEPVPKSYLTSPYYGTPSISWSWKRSSASSTGMALPRANTSVYSSLSKMAPIVVRSRIRNTALNPRARTSALRSPRNSFRGECHICRMCETCEQRVTWCRPLVSHCWHTKVVLRTSQFHARVTAACRSRTRADSQDLKAA